MRRIETRRRFDGDTIDRLPDMRHRSKTLGFEEAQSIVMLSRSRVIGNDKRDRGAR
jgi:hypothetical protein